ncbi:MAG: hypothetical protein K2X69_06110 [Silvanigrellaceae bacterium]|nr:hypothetical protein [Silvanigrellaceae bacterium]
MKNVKTQKGSALLVLIAFFGFMMVAGISFIMYAVSVRNDFVRLENAIHANYEDSKNVHSNYVLKIKEMAQVPKMATEQLTKIVREAIQGRYGDDGSKAVFQFIQEQNPTVDPQLYTNIQKEIAGGRTDFENKMRVVIDSKRVSHNMLDDTVGGFVLEFMGMPRKNIGYNGGKDDYPVIMAAQSAETFKTGIDNGVNMLE